MEPCLNSNSIPRLFISSKPQSVDLNSSRSDFDDLFSVTQRLEQDENVGFQIDRLNQIIETVLLTINEEPSSIMKPSDLTMDDRSYSEISTQTNFDMVSELHKKDSIILKQKLKLKSFKNTENLADFIQNFQNFTEKFVNQAEKQYSDSGFVSFLNEIIEKCRNFYEPLQDVSFKFDSPDVSCISQGLNTSVEFYKRTLQHLSRQISNLTSNFLSFSGNCPEIELPEFVNSILAEVSRVICREKEWELKEKKQNLFDFSQNMQIACEYREIIDLHERLGQILMELEEFGMDSEFTLKLGIASIAVNVYFSEEFRENCLDSVVFLGDYCENRVRGGIKQENIQETKDELRERLRLKEAEFRNCQEMWEGMQDMAQKRIEELEASIDNLMFQLDLKEKQLKLGKIEPAGLTSYLDKLQELREKEQILKSSHEYLELERQKLLKQTIGFYCNKQTSSSSQILQAKTSNTIDVCIGCYPVQIENSTQTESEPLEESNNIEQLTEELYENYSRLEQLPDNEKPDSIIDNIKRIKKRINEIHTKQALIYTEKSIDYAESKLKLIEKELNKSKNESKGEEKELEMCKQEITRLEKKLSDLQNLLTLDAKQSLDSEISKLIRDRVSFQQKEEKFNKKRQLLKQKIQQVNYRQRKITEIEENLNEKKVQIAIQSKKQECFKQAIEEEWARIDSKRQDVLKCQKMIDSEWKNLLAETAAFDMLKKDDELGSGRKYGNSGLMEKLSQIEENALKVEVQFNQIESLKKKLEDDKNKLEKERKLLNEAKEALEQEKIVFYEQNQDLKNQLKILNIEKKVLKENKQQINNLVPKLKNIFKS